MAKKKTKKKKEKVPKEYKSIYGPTKLWEKIKDSVEDGDNFNAKVVRMLTEESKKL